MGGQEGVAVTEAERTRGDGGKRSERGEKEGEEGGREGRREVSWISGAVLQRDTSAF